MADFYEAKVYKVEKIDISGDELKDWEIRDGHMDDPEGIYIKNYTGPKKDIILPATINGKKVRGIDSHGFGASCQVRSIEVPGTYEKIEPGFGYGNKTIEKVVIGEGVTSIGRSFMSFAEKLKEVYVSASVTALDFDCYDTNCVLEATPWYEAQNGLIIIGRILIGCDDSVTNVTVPEGVVTIAYGAFKGGFKSSCPVKKVVLSNTVTRIESSAFANSDLEDFKATESLVDIGMDAFRDTPWLESFKSKEIIVNNILLKGSCDAEILQINQGIKVIGPNAFEENRKIKKIVFPSSVTHICERAFSWCAKLETIEFPKSLVSIGQDAFYECKKIKVLQLPETLEVIGRKAFSQCAGLKSMNIPCSLRSIGTEAFDGCSKLNSVNGVSNYPIIIGSMAFEYCESLKEAEFLKNVYRLGFFAFRCCSSLKSISLSNDLKAVPNHCFFNCSSLEEVNTDSFIDIMSDSCFGNCSSLKTIKVAKKISRQAFENCTSLEKVEFSNETTSIGYGAFSGCSGLKKVELPKKLETIEAQAFYGCTGLEEITIPDSVKNIGDEAFAECKNLATITQPKSYDNFGVDVFINTKYLKETFGEFVIINGILQKYLGKDKKVTLPDNIEVIGQNAFKYSKQIETLIIPDSVKEIEDTVFGDDICDFNESIPNLKELVIGNGVVKIGEKAFYCCKLLENVTFGKNIEYIGDEAFKDCKLPEPPDFKQMKSLKYIGKSAFSAINDYFGSYLYDKIELPPSVETVERSAFLGTRELVVYDTIDPNLEDAEKWEYHKLNGTVNSPLSCALLLSDSYVECQEDAVWRNYTITVKSAKDDSIKYRICCDSDIDFHRDDYRSLLFSAWGKNASFKFDEYDDFFKYVNLQKSKMDMAFCRLSYPYKLSEEHKKQYEAFVIRCLYIERSARNIANYIGGSDDVDKIKFLDGYGIITERNYDWIIEQLEKRDADNCIEYLKSSHSK